MMAVFLVNQCTFSKLPTSISNDQQQQQQPSPVTVINQNGAGMQPGQAQQQTPVGQQQQQASQQQAVVGMGLSTTNQICGLKFDSLFELIHHIEDNHINEVEYQQQQQGLSQPGQPFFGGPQHHHPLHPHHPHHSHHLHHGQHPHHLGGPHPHQQQHIQQQIYSDNQRMQNIINGHWLPTSCILRIFNSTHKPIKKELLGGDNPIGSPATPSLYQSHSQVPTPQPPMTPLQQTLLTPQHQQQQHMPQQVMTPQPMTPQPPQQMTPQPQGPPPPTLIQQQPMVVQQMTPQPHQQVMIASQQQHPAQQMTPQPMTPQQQPPATHQQVIMTQPHPAQQMTPQPLQQPLTVDMVAPSPQMCTTVPMDTSNTHHIILASPKMTGNIYQGSPYHVSGAPIVTTQQQLNMTAVSLAGPTVSQPTIMGTSPQLVNVNNSIQAQQIQLHGQPQHAQHPQQLPPQQQIQVVQQPQPLPSQPATQQQPSPQQSQQQQPQQQQAPQSQPQTQTTQASQVPQTQSQPHQAKTTSTIKPYKCSECGRSYKTQKNFNIHLANQHQKEVDTKPVAKEFNNTTNKN